MALENKLHITDSTELARMEEKISKKKAVELFENGYLDVYEAGTFQMLAAIHKYLFEEMYEFAGEIRTVNLVKGNFRFVPVMYLQAAIENAYCPEALTRIPVFLPATPVLTETPY